MARAPRTANVLARPWTESALGCSRQRLRNSQLLEPRVSGTALMLGPVPEKPVPRILLS